MLRKERVGNMATDYDRGCGGERKREEAKINFCGTIKNQRRGREDSAEGAARGKKLFVWEKKGISNCCLKGLELTSYRVASFGKERQDT